MLQSPNRAQHRQRGLRKGTKVPSKWSQTELARSDVSFSRLFLICSRLFLLDLWHLAESNHLIGTPRMRILFSKYQGLTSSIEYLRLVYQFPPGAFTKSSTCFHHVGSNLP